MTSILTPEQVKEQLPAIYEVFFKEESLHDKFKRLGLPCRCKECRNK